MADAEAGGRLSGRDIAAVPAFVNRRIVRRFFFWESAQVLSFGLRSGDPLGLAPADEFALGLGYIAEKLENDIRDQRACEVLPLPGIQKRHIQDDDANLFFFGDGPPLFDNLFIVSAQPVDALDDKGVARLHSFHQPLISRAVKVLSRELFPADLSFRDAERAHGSKLPVQILLFGGYAGISIHFALHYDSSNQILV